MCTLGSLPLDGHLGHVGFLVVELLGMIWAHDTEEMKSMPWTGLNGHLRSRRKTVFLVLVFAVPPSAVLSEASIGKPPFLVDVGPVISCLIL